MALHAYEWIITLPTQAGGSEIFQLTVTWSDDDLPLDRDVPPSCSALAWVIPRVPPGPAPGTHVEMIPVPEWICDDEQLHEWMERVQPIAKLGLS